MSLIEVEGKEMIRYSRVELMERGTMAYGHFLPMTLIFFVRNKIMLPSNCGG